MVSIHPLFRTSSLRPGEIILQWPSNSMDDVVGGRGFPSFWHIAIASSTIWQRWSKMALSSSPWQPP